MNIQWNWGTNENRIKLRENKFCWLFERLLISRLDTNDGFFFGVFLLLLLYDASLVLVSNKFPWSHLKWIEQRGKNKIPPSRLDDRSYKSL